MKWYVVDVDYVSYLSKFEKKVQNNNYGTNKLKPFVGIILSVNGFDYYVPVSSPKVKHNTMKDRLDFIKIEDFATKNLYGVINLNNMIPVDSSSVIYLDYKNISQHISFQNKVDEHNYVSLLRNELRIIRKKEQKILTNAAKLRNICEMYPESQYAKRSCDFKLLEQKCQEYINLPVQSQQPILPNQIPLPQNEGFTQNI